MKQFLVILLLIFLFASCNNDDLTKVAPEIPPVETMVIDFESLGITTKSNSIAKTNWFYSATTVGVWNLIIGTTFAIPVTAFRLAVQQQPTQTGDLIWQWEYNVDGFTDQYTARLVGEVESASKIKWEMYITKKGIDPFDEFLWFEGKSAMDGKSGQWILYQSAAFPEQMIQIDWTRENEQIAEIIYTYVREKNEQGQTDKFNGSTLTYGLKDSELDIYVNIHAFDIPGNAFADTYIEWNRTNFNGHVKAEHFFNDTNWHCWDTEGNDIDCN